MGRGGELWLEFTNFCLPLPPALTRDWAILPSETRALAEGAGAGGPGVQVTGRGVGDHTWAPLLQRLTSLSRLPGSWFSNCHPRSGGSQFLKMK